VLCCAALRVPASSRKHSFAAYVARPSEIHSSDHDRAWTYDRIHTDPSACATACLHAHAYAIVRRIVCYMSAAARPCRARAVHVHVRLSERARAVRCVRAWLRWPVRSPLRRRAGLPRGSAAPRRSPTRCMQCEITVVAPTVLSTVYHSVLRDACNAHHAGRRARTHSAGVAGGQIATECEAHRESTLKRIRPKRTG
jgi:hypothetical protein